MRSVIYHRQRGQSLVIAVMAMVAIFMVVGFGIDSGLLYAQRRLMQNTADAACLAASGRLARGQDAVSARSAAVDVIERNLGPLPGNGANAPGTLRYTAIAEVYSNGGANVGAGTGLIRGIELSGPQVRVALESPAFTYFIRLLGQAEYTVAARARCNAMAGGGGSPFAVARYRAYASTGSTTPVSGVSTDVSLQGYSNIVRDVLAQRNSGQITQWPNWNSVNYPGTPASQTGLYSPASPAATPSSPGFAVPIAGQDATANVSGGNGFRGPVLLDLRNLTSNPEMYNGLNAQQAAANANKDFITRNILQGYDGPFIPPATQLGFVNGVSAGQVVDPFALRYKVNDIVSVLIYNGTIYGATNFTTSFTSNDNSEVKAAVPAGFTAAGFPPDCDLNNSTGGGVNAASSYAYAGSVVDHDNNSVTLTPMTYSVQVQPTASGVNQNSAYSSNFRMRAFSSVSGAARNDLQVKWDGGWLSVDTNGISTPSGAFGANSTSGRTLNFQVQQSKTGTCTVIDTVGTPDPTNPITGTVTYNDKNYTLPLRPAAGANTFYLEAEDVNTGQRRARYALLRMGTGSNDFYAYMPGLISYQPVRPGNNTQTVQQEIVMERADTGATIRANQVTASFQWFNSSLSPIAQPGGLTPQLRQQGQRDYLEIDVASTVATNVSYYLRTAVTFNGRTHWMWYYLHIQDPLNSSIDSYVHTIGYANFRITQITSNSIWGEAISGLLLPTSYSDLSSGVVAGMTPRLLPWD